ncbi:MAG: ATP synthase F1 subunit delta [Bacteroidetes bacterium]|nr:ATP synthase F1 subunit delta [Bacteroidota bacterium]
MSSRVAARYAKSLLDLSIQQKNEEGVHAEVQDILATVKGSPELRNLLKNPVVASADKSKVLNSIFAKTSEGTRKFIDLVVDRKREAELEEIAGQFISRYNDLKGLAKATVRSAIPLSDQAMNKVKQYLKGAIQRDNVELENIIDPSVIGGMVIRYEDRLLDLSISREIKEIRKQLILN